MNNSLVQENQRRHLDASNELEGKCIISQVKERLQDNTKSSAQPGNRISTWSIDYVTGETNDPVKPLQPLNKDQKLSKDQVSDMHKVLVSERRLESVVTKVWVVFFGCAFSCGFRKISCFHITV